MTKKEELEAQGYKTYENEDIQVFWKPRICQQALSLRSGMSPSTKTASTVPGLSIIGLPSTRMAHLVLA